MTSRMGMHRCHGAKKNGVTVPAGGWERCRYFDPRQRLRTVTIVAKTLRQTKARNSPPSVGRLRNAHVANRTPKEMPEWALRRWRQSTFGNSFPSHSG